MSRLLFSLYLNDLVDYLENEGAKGVELWDLRLCAGDLILLAESETDLKKQMQASGNYANESNLEINPVKSKVMIFNDPKKRKEDDFFRKINNHDIHITNSYKYLSVLIDNKLSYESHIDMTVEKANNGLFCLLKKSKERRGLTQT